MTFHDDRACGDPSGRSTEVEDVKNLSEAGDKKSAPEIEDGKSEAYGEKKQTASSDASSDASPDATASADCKKSVEDEEAETRLEVMIRRATKEDNDSLKSLTKETYTHDQLLKPSLTLEVTSPRKFPKFAILGYVAFALTESLLVRNETCVICTACSRYFYIWN